MSRKSLSSLSILIILLIIQLQTKAQTWTNIGQSYANASGVAYLDASKVIVVGGSSGPAYVRMRKSTDGGSSFSSSASPSNIYGQLNSVSFVNSTIGYAVGTNYGQYSPNKAIYSTTDGGGSWNSQTNPLADAVVLNSVSFFNSSNGIAVGNSGAITWTSDGGTNWNLPTSNSAGTSNLYGVTFYSSSNAIAVGENGLIIKTIDGGNNWTDITPSLVNTQTLLAIDLFNGNTGIAVGMNNVVLRTTDAGIGWSKIDMGSISTPAWRALSFYSTTNGVIAGDGSIGTMAKTTDGGQTWQATTNPAYSGHTGGIFGIAFFDQNNGTAAVEDGDAAVYYVYKITDAALPVQLRSFTFSISENAVTLNWNTATEINNYGFDIERSAGGTVWTKIGFVQGHLNSNSPKNYSFTDSPTGGTQFQYRLKQLDTDGKYEYSSVVNVILTMPAAYAVDQNYPNPFNPATVIKYQIPTSSHVSLKVYDLLGREVANLVDEQKNAGVYNVTFNGSSLSSGVYFYNITAGSYHSIKKMLLIK
jgi:photosystem II stability/assembly factor-like uncharacterized protein